MHHRPFPILKKHALTYEHNELIIPVAQLGARTHLNVYNNPAQRTCFINVVLLLTDLSTANTFCYQSVDLR